MGEITAARAAALGQLGQTAQAIALLEAFPFDNDPHVLLQLAGTYYDLERDDDAAGLFQTLQRIAPGDVAVAHGSAAVALRQGQLQDASALFEQAARARFAAKEHNGGESSTWKITELLHCHDQLNHLANAGKLLTAYEPAREALNAMYETIGSAPCDASLTVSGPIVTPIARALGEFVHYQPPGRDGRPVVNDAIDFAAIKQAYQAQEAGLQVIDDLLSERALQSLNEFFIDSTIWHTAYDGGYVGAFVEDSIFCPLLAQIAEQLRAVMPTLLGPHALRKVWAFKYFSETLGIGVQANDDAINVNLWLTPDEAREPGSDGGLLIWDTPPPSGWDFDAINNAAATSAMEQFIQASGAKAVAVPSPCQPCSNLLLRSLSSRHTG